MLWRRPDVLAVDEPTNHLDTFAKSLLARALQKYRGVGLLVSHDRGLLDLLCNHCLFVDPPEITLRRGGFTKAWEEAQRDALAQERRLTQAKAERKKIERESARRRDEASKADQKRSKRGLAKGDSDGRDKIDRALMSGKDAVAGKLFRQIQGRLGQALKKENEIKTKKTYEIGIWLPGSQSKRDVLFDIEPETLALGGSRSLRHTGLVMQPDDRIALTGPNGTGKSTLIRRIITSLNVPAERLTYVPQEIDVADSARILAEARDLPNKTLGVMMTVISRLGSRPHRLLESCRAKPRRNTKTSPRDGHRDGTSPHYNGRTDQPHGPAVDPVSRRRAPRLPVRAASRQSRHVVFAGVDQQRGGTSPPHRMSRARPRRNNMYFARSTGTKREAATKSP